MNYVRSILQPNERIVMIGRLHWIIYRHAIMLLIVGIALLLIENNLVGANTRSYVIGVTAAVFGVAIAISFIRAWFIQWITELAITDRRVIYKRGFISRHTVEMNMDKVESVDVDQSLIGRLLDYGTINVHGTGEGFESLKGVAHPLALRSAITAK
jgi:uncharacterized membrane protein YdbT with pleckstrin-like domain